MTEEDLDPQEGWVAPAVLEEFPDLRLWWMEVDLQEGKSPPGITARLRHMSGRMSGPQALQLRGKPIPQAYRIFFRHIGMDPDIERIPIEAVVVDRLMYGGFASRSLLHDALLIACVETEVGVWAVDADRVQGGLRIRGAYDREELEPANPHVAPLRAGRLVVADDTGPVAVLFSEPAQPRAVHLKTRRAILYAVQVAGVPDLSVTEALWTAFDILEEGVL